MAVETTKDGRTILTGEDYTAFRIWLWNRQEQRCARCGWRTYIDVPIEYDRSFHTNHRRGRGGGKRDDTWEACEGLCGNCHRKEHNQGRSKGVLQWSRTNAIAGPVEPEGRERGLLDAA